MNKKKLLEKVVVVVFLFLTCICTVKTNICFAGEDIPPTIFILRNDVWIVSSSNGWMKYNLNGVDVSGPLMVVPAETTPEYRELKNKKMNLIALNKSYMEKNNIQRTNGGVIDLRPYDIQSLKANGLNPNKYYPNYNKGEVADPIQMLNNVSVAEKVKLLDTQITQYNIYLQTAQSMAFYAGNDKFFNQYITLIQNLTAQKNALLGVY